VERQHYGGHYRHSCCIGHLVYVGAVEWPESGQRTGDDRRLVNAADSSGSTGGSCTDFAGRTYTPIMMKTPLQETIVP
jgi:hypothetical protein